MTNTTAPKKHLTLAQLQSKLFNAGYVVTFDCESNLATFFNRESTFTTVYDLSKHDEYTQAIAEVKLLLRGTK
jgi:hypothetical protein